MSAQIESAISQLRVSNNELNAARTEREELDRQLTIARSREEVANINFISARAWLAEVAVIPE